MIPALILGREGSIGFPGKNTFKIMRRPLMEYPIIAAGKSKYVDKIYISTDSEKIKRIGRRSNCFIIDRPRYLCTKAALGEDAYVHGYKYIKGRVKENIELIVLLFCNAVTLTSALIDEGIEILRKNPDYDSAVSVSKYNMWSPIRARKIDEEGLLKPFVPFKAFCTGNKKKLNCDRDSQGDVWFADMGVSVVRPRCLDNISAGLLPQKWMGRKIYPLKQWGGCDIDYRWQIPQAEYWLKNHKNYEKEQLDGKK